jgi:PAS domain S-box-containing protein
MDQNLSKHTQVEEALRRSQEELERRVVERTAHLSQANAILQEQIVERQRAEAAEREQRELAEVMSEVGAILSATLSFEAVLDRLLDQIGRIVPYDAANVALVKDGFVHFARTRGYERFSAQFAQEFSAPTLNIATTTNLRQMIETGEALIIPDTTAYPGWINVLTATNLHSWAGAPILVQGQVVALFAVEKVDPGFYQPKHTERLTMFAAQAAIAIHNARLHDQIHQELVERQRAEAALAEERNLLRTLIDNLPDQIYIKDRESRFVMVNPEVLRVFGVTKPEEVLGKSDFDFDSPELVAQFYADEQEIMRSGQPMFNREETGPDLSTGQTIWALSTKLPLRDHQGKIIGIMGINRDITERKQAEEELRKYRDHLEELVEARTAELQATNALLNQEIAERRRAETERERLIVELKEALSSIKTLSGLIPICAACKKIRDDYGYWTQLEVYLRDHSEAEFSHGICPDCMTRLYPEFYEEG